MLSHKYTKGVIISFVEKINKIWKTQTYSLFFSEISVFYILFFARATNAMHIGPPRGHIAIGADDRKSRLYVRNLGSSSMK